MARGEREKRAFEIVKNYLSKNNNKIYFGLFQKDIDELKNIFSNSTPNEKLSQFPDYIFKNGFIEHFRVTSSQENKKGAKQFRKKNEFFKKVNSEKKVFKDETKNINGIEKHWTMKYPEHNYKCFEKSFKSNFENHIKSVNKYIGNKNKGIFIIEYSDFVLEMYENIYSDWIDYMSNGDMREPEKLDCYRLTRDKNLLNYVYSFNQYLKYVIFIYENTRCEIIKLENIPYLLKLLPYDYAIDSKIGTTLITSIYKI